ncbi:MAG TPA: BON domain-containing protein [Steroidobacteraceae bacterium]|nr:BON domain-containing protein [Steroidobacteraceae bacterium]
MPNRNQGYQAGNRSSGQGGRDDDEGRDPRAEDDRDYGSYTESDEGDSSVRAGSYDQGRDRPGRDTREQSGSSGRYAGYGNFGQGDYGGARRGEGGQGRSGQDRSGQDRIGQGGGGQQGFRGGNYGGGMQGRGNYGQSGYGEGQGQGNQGGSASRSGYGREGSGRGFSGYGYEGYGYEGSEQRGGQPGGQSRDQWGRQSGGQSGSQSRWGQSAGEYASGSGMGQHRGKGPKGYQRSDDRIKELICERLREDPEIDPSEVTINVQGGKVTLDGTVDSRQAKNSIEDIAEQFGVQEVQNNLRVQRSAQMGGADSASATSGKPGTEDNDRSFRQNKH